MVVSKIRIHLTFPVPLLNILNNKSNEMRIPLSNLVCNIISLNIDKSALSELEKRYIDTLSKNQEIEMIETIRSASAKKITFIPNIKKRIFSFGMGNNNISKKDLIDNLSLSLMIAEKSGWKDEIKEVKGLIKMAKVGIPSLDKMKKIVLSYERTRTPMVYKDE